MTASGIHIAFFDAGEAADKELPAIGPLDGVLVRGDRLVVESADVAVPDEPGIAITRWLEGVVELQRATGEAPGGRRRASMRVSAPDGLFLRFGSVGEPAASLREIGPFAHVFIGPRTIEANGDVLASRPSPGGGMWTLTANAVANVGAQRPDVGFRTASKPYHPWMTAPQTQSRPPAVGSAPAVAPVPAPSQPVLKDSAIDLLERRARREKEEEARAEERARQLDAALAEADARATTRDREAAAAREAEAREAAAQRRAAAARDATAAREAATARAAVVAREIAAARQAAAAREAAPARDATVPKGSGGTRGATGAVKKTAKPESASSRRIAAALSATPRTGPAERGGGDWLELAWRLRFALVAVVVAVLGFAIFSALQQGSPTARPQERTFNLGQKITGTRWDYVVNAISREPLAGTVRARGVYLVVRITVTNKGGESAQAFPSDVAVVDAAGTRYAAESLQSGVYASPDNRSPFEWPTSYPPGRPVTTRVVFDVDASLRGLQLIITEIPGTKVKLE